jgi:EAL domain-containing protein (putative c-di-GMP-specific phosphodiesterase class I)/ActR/RegA family two-component response regulator
MRKNHSKCALAAGPEGRLGTVTTSKSRDPAEGALADAVVLIVDDNENNVLLLERLLRRVGIGRVVGITDPRETVSQYRAIEPDLILLDLHMPHLDGVAVLEQLGTIIPAGSFTPVLVLTADATLDAKQRALAAGAKDFVTKPFEQTEVLLRVKNLLETRALHLALQRHNSDLEAQLAKTVERERRLAREREDRRARVQQLLDDQDITMVFQPIVDLLTSSVVGVEALARFTAQPPRRPDEWFAQAATAGLGTDLELLAVSTALAHLDQLPDDTYLSVNVSPRTALDPRLTESIRPRAARIVLELTEHAPVDQYDHLLAAMAELRNAGMRIAVDDAGSGYASLQHILRLSPDIIKLDIELIRGINTDPARQSLAAALVLFGDKIGATITAEGIETDDELHTLRRLHVPYGQGYHLGRPGHLPQRTPTAYQADPCPALPAR